MEPIHTAVAAGWDHASSVRSRSMAHRLLAGSGRASLIAYDLAAATEDAAICHGLSDVGELLVACLADEAVPITTWGHLPLRVRLDVLKEAPEWSVRITAFAVHLLGTLTWLTEEVKASYLVEAGLPDRLAELASIPGARLGVIRTDRILLHDSSGVSAVPFRAVTDRHLDAVPGRSVAFPGYEQELTAREVVGRLSAEDLGGLMAAAEAGWPGGSRLVVREQSCAHLEGQVYCVDIDSTALTLMAIRDGFATITRFAFTDPAEGIGDLDGRLKLLVRESASFSPLGS